MGWPELVLILIVLLVIFGAGKLPDVGNAIGRGIRELRGAAEAPDPAASGAPAGDRVEPQDRRDAGAGS